MWCWLACRVLLKIVYLLTRRVLSLAALVFRGDLAKNAELLVLRHENAVLRRYAGRVHYNTARPHPGIAQRVPDGRHDGGHLTATDLDRGPILRRPVRGGLINETAGHSTDPIFERNRTGCPHQTNPMRTVPATASMSAGEIARRRCTRILVPFGAGQRASCDEASNFQKSLRVNVPSNQFPPGRGGKDAFPIGGELYGRGKPWITRIAVICRDRQAEACKYVASR